MKILITGSSGFIGNSLFKELSPYNELFRLDIVKPADAENFFEIDLLKPENVEIATRNFKTDNISVLIHCASILATGENHRDINLLSNNLRITESVIKIANALHLQKLINLSTIGVYPSTDGIYNEKSEIRPSQNFEALYGLSKFCSEELFTFMLNETKTKVVNLRLAQTIGEGMRNDRIYSIMLNELLDSNKITVWGNGERISSFMTIEFLINKIKAIIGNDNIIGLFNIGEKNISYLELAKDIILNHGNPDSKIVIIESGQKSKFYLDVSKIEKILTKPD